MNLINTLLNALTGQNETVLMEFRRRAGGVLPGSINRLDRISVCELVVYYQNGRLGGRTKIKSTRQTLDRYESVLVAASPRIIVHRGGEMIELDVELN